MIREVNVEQYFTIKKFNIETYPCKKYKIR